MADDLFVFAGEMSGDAHGAQIIRRLKALRPGLRITGVAGPLMREEGVIPFMPMENFQIMGYSDVFKNIFRLFYYFKKIMHHLLKEKPKAVLFIDYPGFNLRMAKALRRRKFPNKLIHYICPTVWAHGKKRIFTLAKTLDLLLSIFPFEKEYFEETKLKPTYIGHPLIEKALSEPEVDHWKERLSIPKEHPLVGVFPGSRSQEIKQNFPKILKSLELYKQKNPNHLFICSVVNVKLEGLMRDCLKNFSLKLNQDLFFLPSKENFQIMRHIRCALATSGTITFELGVMQVPTAVVYHLTKLNALIVKYWIKLDLPYYCIVNIITHEHIFPELYHTNFVPEKVAETLQELFEETLLRKNSLRGCQKMLSIMDSKKAPSELAATEIGSLIYG